MKLILSLTVLWMFFSSGGALICTVCTNQMCTSSTTKTCGSETMCVTASIQATSNGSPVQQIYKDCVSSSLCPAVGSTTFSANLGFSSAIASAECCNTDNCNSQTLALPPAQAPNSLQCRFCNLSTAQCTSTVQCTGGETSCFQSMLTSGSNTYPAWGCVTPNICAAAPSLGSLPFMSSVGTISGTPTCNAPTTTAAPTTTTTTPTTTTTTPTTTTTTTSATTSDGCSIRLSVLHLMLGLFIFVF